MRIIPRYFADKACMWLSQCFTQNGNSKKKKKEGEKGTQSYCCELEASSYEGLVNTMENFN